MSVEEHVGRVGLHTPPADEVQCTRHNAVRQLRQNGSGHQSHPAVDFRVGLARSVDVAEVEELRLQLLDQRRRDGERHEDGEQARLHVDLRIAHVVEGEGVEEASL